MGYDPRGVRDKYANYFVNNRNMSIIQQKYAIDNPHHFAGYGANDWGMSAVTGPHGYRAYHPPTTGRWNARSHCSDGRLCLHSGSLLLAP